MFGTFAEERRQPTYGTVKASRWAKAVPQLSPHARKTRAIQGLVHTQDATWLTTEDRGVVGVASNGDTTRFDLAAGLPASWFLAPAADEQGRIFPGSLRNGVTTPEPDGSHRLVEGLPIWLDLRRQQGRRHTIFVGTHNGAAAIQGGRITTLPDLPHPNVYGFGEHRGPLWIATEGGLAVYDNGVPAFE